MIHVSTPHPMEQNFIVSSRVRPHVSVLTPEGKEGERGGNRGEIGGNRGKGGRRKKGGRKEEEKRKENAVSITIVQLVMLLLLVSLLV